MPLYSTGELARRCDTTVRTVQYYDAQGLLKPSALSEGGRRLYTQEDCEHLQLVCLLRSLGLSVASVRSVLEEEHPEAALLLMLDEQERRVHERVRADERLLAVIGEVRCAIEREGHVPRRSKDGIEHDMEGRRRLRRMHAALFAVGIPLDLVEWGTFVYALASGNWVPFVAMLPFAVAVSVLLVRMYYRKTAYLCPSCQEKFKPRIKEFLFAHHSRVLRRLTCPHCGEKGFCVETYASFDDMSTKETAFDDALMRRN